jgi:hypothetical protein
MMTRIITAIIRNRPMMRLTMTGVKTRRLFIGGLLLCLAC